MKYEIKSLKKSGLNLGKARPEIVLQLANAPQFREFLHDIVNITRRSVRKNQSTYQQGLKDMHLHERARSKRGVDALRDSLGADLAEENTAFVFLLLQRSLKK